MNGPVHDRDGVRALLGVARFGHERRAAAGEGEPVAARAHRRPEEVTAGRERQRGAPRGRDAAHFERFVQRETVVGVADAVTEDVRQVARDVDDALVPAAASRAAAAEIVLQIVAQAPPLSA